MIEYKDYISFIILGQEVNLISDETSYGRNTVAEISDTYWYLGDEFPSVAAAILAWQESSNCELSSEELNQVLIDNNLKSSAI